MSRIEEMRMRKLKSMLEWRQRPEANGHQMAEAEAISWALSIVEECLELEGAQ